MFSGTAQRQRGFVIALDPETLGAPRDRRKLPAVRRDQRQKIIDADFQRVDANTRRNGRWQAAIKSSNDR
jgi:hypothetical protein